ncbi:MAG: response regulator transcription factor [Phycisphaerales bacterium JB041]
MGLNVLIIDDEWTIQQALHARLKANAFNVSMAGDGPSGLIAAAEHRPDVILLDLRMPDMDGFEVLRRLRASPGTASIPVIMLTANIQDVVKQQARRAGAADFLTKPYEASVVMDTINAVTAAA